MPESNNQFATGFYAFIIGGMIIIIALNMTLYRYMVERPDDDTQWPVLTIQIEEMKNVLEPVVFDYFEEKVVLLRDATIEHVPLVAKIVVNDFTMLILFRIVFAINMIPLFLLLMFVVLSEGLVKRKEKDLRFKNFDELKFGFCKRIFIATMFLFFAGYVTFPYQFENLFVTYMGASFSILLLCMYVLASNLPQSILTE